MIYWQNERSIKKSSNVLGLADIKFAKVSSEVSFIYVQLSRPKCKVDRGLRLLMSSLKAFVEKLIHSLILS